MLKKIPYRGCAYQIPYITMHASLSRLQCEKSGLLLSTERVWLRFFVLHKHRISGRFCAVQNVGWDIFCYICVKTCEGLCSTFLLICRERHVSHPGYPGAEDQPSQQQLQHMYQYVRTISTIISPPPHHLHHHHHATPFLPRCRVLCMSLTYLVRFSYIPSSHTFIFIHSKKKKNEGRNNDRGKTNRCWALRTKRSFHTKFK